MYTIILYILLYYIVNYSIILHIIRFIILLFDIDSENLQINSLFEKRMLYLYEYFMQIYCINI